MLFVSLSEEVRNRVKAFIDVLGQRGGQALASVFILITLIFASGESIFAVAILLTCGIWLALAVNLKKDYLDVFRETLSAKITETRVAFPALDLASLETLVSTLNDSDDRKVLAALDLLAAQGKVRVIPALILYHPSAAVVVHALELFVQSGREDFLPTADRLLAHSDPDIRAAALQVRSLVRPEEAQLRHCLNDPSAAVRATALAALASSGWVTGQELQLALQEVVTRGTDEAQLALVTGILYHPAPVFEGALLKLAESTATPVLSEVVRAMEQCQSLAFLPQLVRMLGQRELRERVQETLVAMGPEVLPHLDAALRDLNLPHSVRRHLPRTIGRFSAASAASILLAQLGHEEDGMIRYKLLRKLGELLALSLTLPLDDTILQRAIQETLTGAFSLMKWRRSLLEGSLRRLDRATPGYQLLVELLRDKQVNTLERLFRLLSLRYRNEDFKRIHRGLWSSDRQTRAGSRELLENLVSDPLPGSLITLVDDLSDPTASPDPDGDPVEMEYESVLRLLLQSQSQSLSSLAAYHVGELGLVELRNELEAIRSGLSGLHAEVVEYALNRLSGSANQQREHGQRI